ncbi:hypothetical protein [Paludifilum halophilum]|uniref:Peptidase M23 domain-containing protein n=1 Tax=Paludifilum halophilum TaxID=1642702 RepID=A0A235B4K5_9BACL|nr:hypothetical protein [Paludifilum halophilum]OYD07213.1 hypothetical protein CHM34_12580 [Paludifilum halophilum]
MRKWYVGMLGLVLTLGIIFPSYSYAAGVQTMSDKEIDNRYEVIDGDDLVKNEPRTGNDLTREELFDKYNLNSNVDVPKGTEVIKFDNVKNADKFFNKIEEDVKNPTVEKKTDDKFHDLGYTRQVRSVSFGFSDINLHADIYWNSGKTITSCKAWTTHTGTTFSLGWDQKYAYCSPSSGSRSTMVKGGGTGKWVVFVEGIGTVYSKDINIHYGYTVP